MKFFNLFKKELRELITFQTLAGLLVGILAFLLLGNFMGSVTEGINKNTGDVVVADYDKTTASAQAIDSLKLSGFNPIIIDGTSDVELAKQASDKGQSGAVVIPQGFGEGIVQGKVQEIKVVSTLKSFSVMGNLDQSAQVAAGIIKDMVSGSILKNAAPNADTEYIKNPVITTDVTVANDKSQPVNASALQGFAMQQSLFIPIIVFILIMFATQLNASAIANEKGDKTLETLLSAPVSRLSVLGSKMCASGVLSLLMAAVYMFGFSSYMNSMTGDSMSGDATAQISQALSNLGLQLSAPQYALIGVQLFLTILIALAISMILGALAKDLKSAQGLMMPLMFLTMIPYLITMFVDVNTLPTVGRLLLYAIPFTHTFTASSNLLFGNNVVFFGGMLYQVVILIVTLGFAVHVFSTDKIFTMTLDFSKKTRSKKTAIAE